MSQHCTSRILFAVMLFLTFAVTVFGQTAQVTGRVSDQTGAVVSGAKVTVTSEGTGFKRATVSNEEGYFTVPSLQPGSYQLSIQKDGFKPILQTGLVLQVEQAARLDFTLQTGTVTEEVRITSEGPILEREAASLGQVIENKTIVSLPLNGRNFMQLAALAAGTIPIINGRSSTAANVAGRTGLSVNIAGGRDDSNSFLIDGIESRQPWLGTASILPSVDAIQEFKIQRNLFSAEYGQGSGIVNVSIKSGGNEFHGSAFEFLRNEKLDARNFFDQRKPPFRMNQFGGTIGGAVIKDRTFFFGNYEGLRTRRSNTLIGNFPLSEQLAGNFSSLPAGAIIDPLTGQPFPNNQIPEARMSAVAKRYRTFFPSPNRNVPGANYITEKKQVNDFDQFNIRVDQKLGEHDNGFVRYSYNDSILTVPSVAPFNGQRDPFAGQNLAIQETHVFGPRAVNVFKAGYNRGRLLNLIENTQTDVGTELGFKNLNNSPQDFSLPTFRLIGVNTTGQNFLNQGSTSNLFQFADTLSLKLGNHSVNTGGELRIHQFQVFSTLFRQGLTVFAPVFTRNAVADFLLGLPVVALYQNGQGGGNLRSRTYSFFVQDDWKITPKLTLNLGLRYDYDAPWTEIDDRQGFFDPSVPGGQIRLLRDPKSFGFQATSPLLTFGGLRRGIVEPDRNNIAPRFGFAYSLSSHTVLRGGYGIFYAAQSANEFTAAGGVPPFVVSPGIRPGTPIDTLFPDVKAPTYDLTGVAPPSIDPFRESPYMQQWSLSVQQTLLKNLLLEVSYSGSKGAHLWERVNINSANLPTSTDTTPATTLQSRRPFPKFGDVLAFLARERSNYNALQVRLEKRFESGLGFLLSYSFSKSIDTASGGFFTSSHQDRANLDGERARSNFDAPHALVFSHTYDLPFGRGKAFLSGVTGALDKLVSGWQLNGILTLISGQPISILVDGDNAFVGGFTAQRANRSGDGNLSSGQRTPERWFDTSAFATPPRGTFGNSGRNIIDGPGTNLYDFSLFKNTSIKEKVTVQFRTEFFNFFNHANFLSTLGAGFDRVNAGAAFGRLTQARNAREIQFGLKLIF